MKGKGYLDKLKRASVEGKVLRLISSAIRKRLERIIGIFTRKVVFSNHKVVKNKIFFNTFQGDYTCNPKYITEELLKQCVDCEIVWGVRIDQLNKRFEVPDKVRMVNRYSYEFYEEMATSKIWIINSVEIFKNPIEKKKNQFLIETWHGSLGIKRFDRSANSGRAWVNAADIVGKIADFCLSNSAFENSVYRESFWPKTQLLEYGHPRNDVLFYSGEQKEYIKERVADKLGLKIKGDVHYILYGPTFRDSHQFDCYNLNYEKLIDSLQKKYGGEWYVLVRFHPTVREYSENMIRNNPNIINATNYPDIQELMVVADIAITDYSSWIYDFVLTRKPGFIFATDIEMYNDERGFYYPLETTPFPIATTNEALMENIAMFDNDLYCQKVETFLENKGCIEDGHASERVVEKIKEIIGAEK